MCVSEYMYFRDYNFYIDLAPEIVVSKVSAGLKNCIVMFLQNTCFPKNTCFHFKGLAWLEKVCGYVLPKHTFFKKHVFW